MNKKKAVPCLEDRVNLDPVQEDVLHDHVIDQVGLAQGSISLSLQSVQSRTSANSV